jgi:hypothetical protein
MNPRLTDFVGIPLALLLWFVDFYVFMVLLRLGVGWLPPTRNGELCIKLHRSIDPVPRFLNERLFRWCRRPCREWCGWALVVGVGLVLHCALIGTIFFLGLTMSHR